MGDPFEDCACGDVVTRDAYSPVVVTSPLISVVVEGPPGAAPPPIDPTVTYVKLGPGSWQTNQPFRLINEIALAITAVDSAEPWADGITLESGQEGQSVHAAIIPGKYDTPLALPGVDGDFLWMSKTAMAVTNEMPSLALGYTWALQVARRVKLREFIFFPSFPIRMAL
jgi:hypothetical protein